MVRILHTLIPSNRAVAMAMTRRNFFLPDELWERVRMYAVELTGKEGVQVSTAEALRRLIERALEVEGVR